MPLVNSIYGGFTAFLSIRPSYLDELGAQVILQQDNIEWFGPRGPRNTAYL